jgi:hypothetical protein
VLSIDVDGVFDSASECEECGLGAAADVADGVVAVFQDMSADDEAGENGDTGAPAAENGEWLVGSVGVAVVPA